MIPRLHSITAHWLGRSKRMTLLLGFSAGRTSSWLYRLSIYVLVVGIDVFIIVPDGQSPVSNHEQAP